MKAQYSQVGKVINYTNTTSTDILYNDVVKLGGRIGVAAENIAAGATGSVQVEGVYLLPAATTEAFAVGDVLYLSAEDKVAKTASDTVVGWAIAAKEAAGATAMVKINDVIITSTPAAAKVNPPKNQ